MSLCRKPVVGQRRFVTVPYVDDGNRMLMPTAVKQCPEAEPGDTCELHAERWRSRVFGPGFKLFALYCLTHDRSFTVYPPGWTPYGRASVVPIDHRGRLVVNEEGESGWQNTAFTAVIDADKGIIWPEEVKLGPVSAVDEIKPPGCRRTQRRHIAGAMLLFALDSAATMLGRELVCRALGIDLMPLEAGVIRIRDGPGLKVRGEEGAKVLEQLPEILRTISGLIALGVSRGFWGPTLS